MPDSSEPNEKRKNRRSLIALFGGAAAFGLAKKAAAQQPSTVSNLPFASTPFNGSELTYVVQNGVSKKTPISTIVPPPATLAGLSDIQVTEGPGINGFALIWNNSITKWIASAITGGGVSSVTSTAAIQSLVPATGQTVYLNSGGLSGSFAWNPANLSTAVTNDPGKGIYVPLGTDPTGASGAWVRQYTGEIVDFGWWGAVGDGVAENHLAWVNWSWWARWQSSLGNGVNLLLQPGLYLTDLSQCFYCFANIKHFTFSADGASFQNTSTTFPTPFFVAASPMRDGSGSNVYQNWFITNTTPGSTAFVLETSTDASNLTTYLGQGSAWILLTSVSLQAGGFPPNLHRFDFVKAVSATQYASAAIASATYNSGTGVIALTFAAAPFGATVGSTLNGAAVPISALTGTGAFASLDGTWPIISTASAGTVINLQGPRALTATITGGTLGPVGAVIVDRPLRYTHLQNFPDDLPTGGGFGACGKARVWFLDTPNWSTRTFPNLQPGAPTYPFSIWLWDVKHVYKGITVLAPTHFPTSVEQQTAGRYLETYGWKGIGVSDSVGLMRRHVGDIYSTPGEVDKLLVSVEFKDCEFPPNSANVSLAQVGVQSTSIETISFKNCYLPQGVTGAAKTMKYDSCNMGGTSVFAGPGLGLSYSIAVTNCRVGDMSPPFFGGSLVVNDGVGVTYANGLFTINKAASAHADWFVWQTCVPGQQLYLNPASVPRFAGNTGMGYITNITADATNLYVQTTLSYATLPSWAVNNQVLLVRTGEVDIRGSSGCQIVETASEACKKGLFPHEYTNYKWAGQIWPPGQTTSNAGGSGGNMGIVSRIVVNVMQAFTGAGSGTLAMTYNLYDSTSMASIGNLVITIDVTKVGIRTLTQTAFTLPAGTADTFTNNGSTITALPTNGQVGANMSWSFPYTQTQYVDNLLPVIEWECFFDCGAYQKIMVNPGEAN
jgi:hypothetical protein